MNTRTILMMIPEMVLKFVINSRFMVNFTQTLSAMIVEVLTGLRREGDQEEGFHPAGAET